MAAGVPGGRGGGQGRGAPLWWRRIQTLGTWTPSDKGLEVQSPGKATPLCWLILCPQGRRQGPRVWSTCFLCGSSLIHTAVSSAPLFSSQNRLNPASRSVNEVGFRVRLREDHRLRGKGDWVEEILGESKQKTPLSTQVALSQELGLGRRWSRGRDLPYGDMDLRNDSGLILANSDSPSKNSCQR